MVVPARAVDRAGVHFEVALTAGGHDAGIGAADRDVVEFACHVREPVVLVGGLPAPVLDDDEGAGLFIDDAAVHLGHVEHERGLRVAAGDETRVQCLQGGGLSRANGVDFPSDLVAVDLSPVHQLGHLVCVGGEREHVEQQVCLFTGQGVDRGDEAVPEALETVLEGAAEEFVDDPSLGEATLDEALAFGQPGELLVKGGDIVFIESHAITSASHLCSLPTLFRVSECPREGFYGRSVPEIRLC